MLLWWWLGILFAAMTLASAASLTLYAWDKRKATKGGWRVPEKRLHLCSLLGGWPGALVGQHWLRHKTKKRSFRVVFWLTLVVHLVASGIITYAVWLEVSAN